MAPIPITFSEDAASLIAAAQRRQTDLIEFQIPRLRSCQGPLSVQQDLAAELREDIDSFARQVEALELCVEDQKGQKNRLELRQIVDEFYDLLSELRRDSRAALLASKRAIDSQSKSQREELLASAAATEKQSSNEKVTDDTLMKTNDDVTEALRRTIGVMQGELERSVLSTQMLDSSTASLRATSSTHDTLTSVMGTSKQLITALEKSDWLDRVLIISAFVFFILVVLFIIQQRLLDRGLRMALWWTRFIPDFSDDAELLKMEKGSAVLSSTTSLLSAVAASSLSGATVAASLTSSLVPSETSEVSTSTRTTLDAAYSQTMSVVPDSSDAIPTTSIEAQRTSAHIRMEDEL
ncbi:Protein transport protein sec20 [Hypsizygus marmoreus]|uniref:Protein transport protein sec20 n=1 Tax=Hypsizygus marmoreus TaxID=39966 RepID=A0A369KFW7_HYPMA|nr:Protein transport protein sec20 [Hypsizygus marmoreus]